MHPNRSDHQEGPPRPHIVEKQPSYLITAAFYEVYNALGYGYPESLYSRALEIALKRRGLLIEREYPAAIRFQGEQIGFHRLDMLIERRIIAEIKSTELLSEASKRQLRSHLTGTGLKLGVLLHFGPKASHHRILGRSIRSDSENSDQVVPGPE